MMGLLLYCKPDGTRNIANVLDASDNGLVVQLPDCGKARCIPAFLGLSLKKRPTVRPPLGPQNQPTARPVPNRTAPVPHFPRQQRPRANARERT